MNNIKNFTFAGHSAVFFETDNNMIAIDPWLYDNPMCPDSLKNPKLDLIILTHGHADHASDVLRLALGNDTAVVATYELAMILRKEGLEEFQVIPMNKGGTLNHNGLSITLTHAMHSNSFDTSNGTLYAGEACGVVIKDSVNSFYHAGDTALFSDMTLIRDIYEPGYAFLPIGDRFTMGPKEASKAQQLLKAKNVIPIHFNTFEMLTGTLSEFKNNLQLDANLIELNPGEKYEI